jgi:cytochrome P450
MVERPTLPLDLADASAFDAGVPHETFAAMRATPGLTWNPTNDGGADGGDGFWCVGRYADVSQVSRDPATFGSAAGHIQIYNIDEDALAARASMIDMDPPEHTRLRRLVAPAFMPNIIKSYEPIVRKRVSDALDTLMRDGGGDWVKLLSKPIPIGIICDMLGVPPEDHDLMIELTDYLVAGTSEAELDPGAYGNTTPLRLLPFNSPAAHGLRSYASELGELRRRSPRDDLVSTLVHAEVGGERLTDEEYTNFFRLLVFAGNETTRSAMSHLALQWVMFPEQFERLSAEPKLLDSAVEEVVRYASPILYFRRTAMCDTTLAGTPIKAGERVVMWYASANFDEAQFEDAMRFDVSRPRSIKHAGFGGGGVHICLGAWLARLELKALLSEISDRGIRCELAAPPEYVSSNFVNGIEHLEVNIY